MLARAFWKAVTVDRADLLTHLLAFLSAERVRYCVIGGLAVNAYVDPVVTLDLDVVFAADDLTRVRRSLATRFDCETFAHSVNVSAPDSDLRVQIQTDPRYTAFVDRAVEREVLGVILPVASVDDVLQGKLWAFEDAARRPSKRQKDLADISRLVEAYPDLRHRLPQAVLDRLV